MGVLSETECKSRQNIMFLHYIGIVEMEANCLVDMVHRQIVPLLRTLILEYPGNIEEVDKLTRLVQDVKNGLDLVHVFKDTSLYESAKLARTLRLETMCKLRDAVDRIEGNVDPVKWPFASYKDLLFLDQN
jgi:glutamine synthetase